MALSAWSCSARRLAQLAVLGGDFHFFERDDVPRLVRALARFEPVVQPLAEILVGEILAPERGVFDAGLGERAVEIEHADQSGPGARPVGDGEDRPAVRDQAAQHVVRVLPDRLGDDDGRLGIEAGEDVHSFALRGEKAVLFLLAIVVGADDRHNPRPGRRRSALPPSLSGPASISGWPRGADRRWRRDRPLFSQAAAAWAVCRYSIRSTWCRPLRKDEGGRMKDE